MQIYELGYLILPSVAEDALPGVTEKMKDAISKAGGSIVDSEAPFEQALAYNMSKTIGASRYVVSDAYIGWIKFDSEPAKVESLKDELRKMNELLRYLLVKAPKETSFTFAKARAALEEKEEKELPPTPAEEVMIK